MFKGTTDNGKTFIPASTYWLCMSKGIGSMSWPGASSHKRATPLGLLMESDLDEIVCAYS